jgi:crossover junction endodeoxyribonuclease RuvC
MLILGLDPGSAKTGYGLIRAEGEQLALIAAGVISAPAGWTKYRRMAEIGRDIDELFAEQIFEGKQMIDAMALEAGFVSMQKGFLQQGALVSAAARGVAGFLAARRGVEVFEYANNTVKKAVTGDGRAEKAVVATMVQRLLRMTKAPAPDAGDALAVAITHARAMVAAARLARAQRAAA